MSKNDKYLIDGEQKSIKVDIGTDLIAVYNKTAKLDDPVVCILGENHCEYTYYQAVVICNEKNVSVSPRKPSDSHGVFNIAKQEDWLYDKQIYPDPEAFKHAILDLIKFSVLGSGYVTIKSKRDAPSPDSWLEYVAPLAEEDIKIFNEATNGLLEDEYQPVAVSTQVKPRGNYNFFCNKQPIFPGPTNRAAIVKIETDADGVLRLDRIIDIIES